MREPNHRSWPLRPAPPRPNAGPGTLDGVSRSFILHDAVLLGAQALIVLAPGAGVPAWVARLRSGSWALVLPISLAAVVAAIALLPQVADGLTWLALLTIPPLAAAALGWAGRGARPWIAVLAVPLLVLAWADQSSLRGQTATLALEALSCVTLGRLLAGVAPVSWLKAGIVAMAVLDAVLVFSDGLTAPNAVLNAAVPAQGLPQLQFVEFGPVTFGFGDLFVAGVLGAVLAVEGRRQAPVAALAFGLSVIFDLLFLVTDSLPATVPIAAALVISEAARRQQSGWARARAPGHRPPAM